MVVLPFAGRPEVDWGRCRVFDLHKQQTTNIKVRTTKARREPRAAVPGALRELAVVVSLGWGAVVTQLTFNVLSSTSTTE